MLVANDVPNELIEIVKHCDFSIIPQSDRQAKLSMLKQVANQHLPQKTSEQRIKGKYLELNLGNCPAELVHLVNGYDFSKVSTIKKKLAIPFIKAYLTQSGIYRK